MKRTLAERASIARAINDSRLFGLRATSETLHLFTEEQIARAQAARIASIDRHRPKTAKPRRKSRA